MYYQTQKLLANDGQGGDEFGHSVSMSADGKMALIGANVRFVVMILIVFFFFFFFF